MLDNWINSPRNNAVGVRMAVSVVLLILLSGCASKLKDVANADAPNMKEIYDGHTGGDPEAMATRHATLLRRPALYSDDLQTGLPPYPERLDHLYPRLPNPDLVMYVRPHAVGQSGAPIPAYITRFTMYERQPYALPGESLESLRIDNRDQHDVIAARQAAEKEAAESRHKRTQRARGVR